MSTCSVLVNVPEFPFRLEDLCPSRALAAMAAGLQGAGQETIVLDFATATHVDRFDTPAIRRSAGRAKADRQTRLASMISRARRDRCREVALQIAEMGPPDFVVYRIAERGALRIADMIRAILVERCPESIHVLAGEFIDTYGALALPAGGGFACACAGDPEQVIPALAERLRTPARWAEIPGIHVTETAAGETWRSTPLAEFPPPRYDASQYPALIEGGKLRIFTLELVRPSGPRAPARVLGAARAVEQIEKLRRQSGARGFVLDAENAPAGEVAAFAEEVISAGTRIRFVLRTAIRSVAAREMLSLREAGCVAVEFSIPTGSQRLLDDFYRSAFGVTQAETVLRAARDAGLFVSVHMTYPAPCDDRHTRAETLRLLRRTRPDAVSVDALALRPGTPWYSDPSRHGFGLEEGGVAGWIATEAEVPYHYLGGDASTLAAERALLLEELSEDGLIGAVSSEEILAARLLYPNQPAASGLIRLREAVASAQGEALLQLVEEFNAALPGISHRGLRPFVPVLEAVGN